MNPYEIATSLRHIAARIQNSKNPDRDLVIKDIRKVLVAMGAFEVIVIHRYADNTFVDVTTTDQVIPNYGNYASINLPDGDTVSFSKGINAVKANENMEDDQLLEALYNVGILEINPRTGLFEI
jgi:hypothetical protein